jgi:hypothetical protein
MASKSDTHRHTHTLRNIYIVSCYMGNTQKVDKDTDNAALDV